MCTEVDDIDERWVAEAHRLLEPVVSATSRIDMHKVAMRLDAIPEVIDRMHRWEKAAEDARREWEADVEAYETEVYERVRADESCDLAKNKSREEHLRWAMRRYPETRATLQANARKRERLSAAVSRFRRLIASLELAHKSCYAIYSATKNSGR